MAAGRPQLHDLKQADQDDGYGSDKQPSLRKRKAYGETNQNEGEGVFAILAQRGVRAVARRTERRKYDRRDQDCRAYTQRNFHCWRIAQFVVPQRPAERISSNLLPYANSDHESLPNLHGIAIGGADAGFVVNPDRDERRSSCR
jgi:hypothetical protein